MHVSVAQIQASWHATLPFWIAGPELRATMLQVLLHIGVDPEAHHGGALCRCRKGHLIPSKSQENPHGTGVKDVWLLNSIATDCMINKDQTIHGITSGFGWFQVPEDLRIHASEIQAAGLQRRLRLCPIQSCFCYKGLSLRRQSQSYSSWSSWSS